MIHLFAALLLASPSFADIPCEPVFSRPAVSLQKCGKLKVLTLHGNPTNRAQTYGSLFPGPLSPEVIDYFSHKALAMVPDGKWWKGFLEMGYAQVVRLFHRRAPREMAEEIDAFAASLGVDSIYLKRAISLPDIGVAMNYFNTHTLPEGGCTSVAARRGPNFLHGRNLDFAGVGRWDAHPLLTLIFPEEGSAELKHAVFGADGVHFGGITGVNEAGITFAVHQNYSRDASFAGVPMMMIGEMVLRRAHTLAEAEEILRRQRPAVLWTFVLTDLKTGEAMAVETSGRHFSLRRMEGDSFVQTNHLMHAETQKVERIALGTKLNSVHRMKVAHSMLEEKSLSVEKVAAILAYTEEPSGELSAHRDIMKAHNIQTVLYSSNLESKKVFVSQDSAPAAAGTYVAFDLRRLFAAGPLSYELLDPVRPSPEKRARQLEISSAFAAYFDDQDYPQALQLLEGHRTLDAALFRATVKYQQGYYQDAILQVDEALANPRFRDEPLYLRQSVAWVKLASLVAAGKIAEAKTLATNLAEEKPENLRLRELAETVASGAQPSAELLRLAFEFFSGDVGARPN